MKVPPLLEVQDLGACMRPFPAVCLQIAFLLLLVQFN